MPLSKDALERLIEASPDIVVATDDHGMVSFYNDGARENLGYSREEIIGSFVAQLYPSAEEAKRVMAAMRDPGGPGKGRVVNFPTTYVAKNGEQIPVAISGVILYGEADKEEGTIGFAKDLREILRKDQLAVLGEIAIGLSHKINNPLEVITNQLDLLERGFEKPGGSRADTPEARRVRAIREEIGRVAGQLRRLDEMARREEYSSTGYLGDARMIDLEEDAASAAAPERSTGSRSPLADHSVLVVDDDAGVRESVAEVLRAEACDVETAGDAEAALRRLGERPFDLVLSDVVMPGMDGYELFLEVQRRHPAVHMALMTAYYYDKDHIIKRSRLEGLEGVLFKKPIDPDRLRKVLGDLINPPPPAPS